MARVLLTPSEAARELSLSVTHVMRLNKERVLVEAGTTGRGTPLFSPAVGEALKKQRAK